MSASIQLSMVRVKASRPLVSARTRPMLSAAAVKQMARKIGEKPLTVEDTHVAGLFDDSTRENRRRSRDEHLVEDSSRIRHDQQKSTADVAARTKADGLNRPGRDRGEHGNPRDA